MTRKMIKDVYPTVTSCIREKGINYVKKIVFGEAVDRYGVNTNEAVAISNFISSRMFKKEILNKLK